MSTWLQRAENTLEQHKTAVRIIEGLASFVADALAKPGSNASAALAAVKLALDAIIKGFDGKITREEAEKMIKDLMDRRAAMHAAIDASLDDKFDDGGSK